MSEPTARSPLPGLPPLDPVPWTGTAAPGNTGRPYGEVPEAARPWNGVPTGTAPVAPAQAFAAPVSNDPNSWNPAGGQPRYLTGDQPIRPSRPTGGPAGSPNDAISAQRAGRRALRTAIIGGVLGVVGFILAAASVEIGVVALFVAVVLSLVAFVTGIGAVRAARRTRTSAAPGGVATALGAVGLCFVLLMGAVVVAFRAEIGTYITCVQRDPSSKAATQACTQSFVDTVQRRTGG